MTLRWILWLVLTILAWLITLHVVPHASIRRFWRLAVAGGGFFFFLHVVAVSLMDLWDFGSPPLSIAGVPLFLPAVYAALVAIFAQYLPAGANERMVYIVGFAALNDLLDWVLLSLNLMVYLLWDLLATFFLGIATYMVVLYLYQRLVPVKGS